MKKMMIATLLCALVATMSAQERDRGLSFDAKAGVKASMTYVDGTKVSYTAYEGLFYVTNVEDSTYQTMNVMCPTGQRSRRLSSCEPTWVAICPQKPDSRRGATLQVVH